MTYNKPKRVLLKLLEFTLSKSVLLTLFRDPSIFFFFWGGGGDFVHAPLFRASALSERSEVWTTDGHVLTTLSHKRPTFFTEVMITRFYGETSFSRVRGLLAQVPGFCVHSQFIVHVDRSHKSALTSQYMCTRSFVRGFAFHSLLRLGISTRRDI